MMVVPAADVGIVLSLKTEIECCRFDLNVSWPIHAEALLCERRGRTFGSHVATHLGTSSLIINKHLYQ